MNHSALSDLIYLTMRLEKNIIKLCKMAELNTLDALTKANNIVYIN